MDLRGLTVLNAVVTAVVGALLGVAGTARGYDVWVMPRIACEDTSGVGASCVAPTIPGWALAAGGFCGAVAMLTLVVVVLRIVAARTATARGD